MINRRSLVRSIAAAALALSVSFAPAFAAEKVTVFAAASLKNALDEVSAAWKAGTGKETANSYAASSALASPPRSRSRAMADASSCAISSGVRVWACMKAASSAFS